MHKLIVFFVALLLLAPPAFAADWGITGELGSTTSMNWLRCMGGTFSGGAGQQLDSVSAYTHGVDDVRFAVYEGGVLSVGPDTADLFVDSDTISSVDDGLTTYNVPSPPALTNGENYWICIKGVDNVASITSSTDSGDAGDFQTAEGRYAGDNDQTDDPAVGWEDPWGGAAGSFSDFWYAFSFEYSAISAASIAPVIISQFRRRAQ